MPYILSPFPNSLNMSTHHAHVRSSMSTAILNKYMHICYLSSYKIKLIKSTQLKLVGKINERTPCLISGLYNCMAIDQFGYASSSQSTHREYAQHAESSLTDHFSFAGFL